MALQLKKSSTGNILVESHRGAEDCGPENSWQTIELAHQLGADLIEVDVQISRDGVLFLRHNYSLPDGRWCRDLDWPTLSEVRIDGHPFPKLEDILEWAKQNHARLSLDLKGGFGIGERLYPSVLAMLERMGMIESVLLLDWNHIRLLQAKKSFPKVATRALFRGKPVNLLEVVLASQADAVSLSYDLICQEDVDQMRTHGIAVAMVEMWQPDFLRAVELDVDIVSWGNPKQAKEAIDQITANSGKLGMV
jgi:glycerophosphoryl diester phosphodiesterase